MYFFSLCKGNTIYTHTRKNKERLPVNKIIMIASQISQVNISSMSALCLAAIIATRILASLFPTHYLISLHECSIKLSSQMYLYTPLHCRAWILFADYLLLPSSPTFTLLFTTLTLPYTTLHSLTLYLILRYITLSLP